MTVKNMFPSLTIGLAKLTIFSFFLKVVKLKEELLNANKLPKTSLSTKVILFTFMLLSTNLFLVNQTLAVNYLLPAASYGAQTGSLTYGTASSVTYSISYNITTSTGTSNQDQLALAWTGGSAPAGVTYTFTTGNGSLGLTGGNNAAASFLPTATTTKTITLTIFTSNTTPTSTAGYGFTLTTTDNNGGVSGSSTGLALVVTGPKTVTGIATGSQTGTATFGTAAPAITYTNTLTETGTTAASANSISVAWSGGTPTGVTTAFTAGTQAMTSGTAYTPNGTNGSTITLTVSTTAATPAGSYNFIVTTIDNNGGGTTTSNGTLVVISTARRVTGIATGSQTGTATFGTAAPAITYTNTLTETGSTTAVANSIGIAWSGGTPTGVTTLFSSGTQAMTSGTAYTPNGTTGSTITLTVSTTAATPVGSYNFTVTNIDNNGAGTTTSNGTLVVLAQPKRVTAIATGSQSGTAFSGTAASAITYTNTLTETGTAAAAANSISIAWSGGTPSGVTTVFSSGTQTMTSGTAYTPNGTTGSTITLTVSTTAATPAGSYNFTITNIDNNGGGTTTSNGTLVVLTPPKSVTAIATGSQTGTAGYGTGVPAITYTNTLAETGTAAAAANAITITWSGGTPTGVTTAFTAGTQAMTSGSAYTPNGTTGSTIILTVSTTAATPAGTYNFTVTNVDNNGGGTTTSPGTLVVATKALTITANNQTKVYGTAFTFAGTEFTTTGLVGSDAVTSVTFTSGGGASTASVAGSPYSITASAAVGSGLANYSISYVAATFTVTAKALTITSPLATSRVYNGTTAATITGTLSGIVSPDVVTLSGTGTFASANVANGISVTPACTLTGANAGNYTLTQPPTLTANITAAPLTITATNITKVYGTLLTGAAGSTAFTPGALQNGETIGSVTIAYGTGAAINAPVGTNTGTVTATAATGGTFTAGNYSITYLPGNIIITAKPLTVTGAIAGNKPYDGTTTASITGATLVGVVSPDVVGISTTGTFASANVGTGIGVTLALTGANAGNYTLTQPGITANITAKTLTVAGATAGNKVYDGTLIATITGGTLTGVVSPDVVSVSTAGTFASANVANGIVVTLALTGANAGNYTLTQPGITANITTAPLTIAANNVSKVYGTLLTGAAGSTAFTPGGLKNGETIGSVTVAYGTGAAINAPVGTNTGTVTITAATGGTFTAGNYSITYTAGNIIVTAKALTVTGATASNKPYDGTTTAAISGATLVGVVSPDVVGIGATGTFASANVGTGIAVTLTLTGANAANYTLTQPGITANITAAPLTITANNISKVYGTLITGAAGSTAFTSSGLQNSETIGSVTIAYGTGSAINAPVGTYTGTVTATLATGGTFTVGNYSITYIGGNITITPKNLTEAGATASNKVYDGTTTATVSGGTLTGVVSPDVVSISTTGTFASANVANGIVVTLALTGANAGNYTLTQPGISANITPKSLTIIGGDGADKVYDGTTAGTVISGTLSGVVSPDVVTINTACTFASANVGTGIVFTFSIGGANAGNYTLIQPGSTGNITPKALTVSGATAANKVYDATTAATITGGTLSGVISPDVVSVSTAGTFASANAANGITVTLALTGANAGNYTLTQPGITANITPKALTITGITISNKTYDGTTVASISGTATLVGIIGADAVILGGSPTAVFASKNVATGIAITVSGYSLSGASAGNYSLTQPSGFTANITTATLNIVATGPVKVNNVAQGNLSGAGSVGYFNYYGTVPGESITSVTLTLSSTVAQTAGSAYTVTPSLPVGAGGFSASNYSITYTLYNGIVAGHIYTWTGGANTVAWTTTGNWSSNPSGGTYPGSGGVTYDAVVLPGGTTYTPTLSSNITVNTLTYTGSNTLTIASAIKLTSTNSFIVNAAATNANLVFSGASTSTIVEFNSSVFSNYGGFNISGTGLFQVDANGSYIYNGGTITANGNCTLYLQGGGNTTHALTNAGTFYAGTANSNCNIEMDDYGSIENSGTFYVGPTSLMYYFNDSANNCIIDNASGGTFTFQSNANGSAAIGEIPQGKNNIFTGTFNVERYYQGSPTYYGGRFIERNYRIISSCVNTGTIVNTNYVFGLNYIVGATAGQTTAANSATNAFITGCTGCNIAGGNPSIYLYNESKTPSGQTFISGNFLGITNITNSTSGGTITASDGGTYSLPVGTGVFFFFRGAATNWATRTVSPYIAPDNVTLTSTGNMNVGSYTFKDWYTPTSSNLAYTGTGTGTNSAVRGFNMLGNPYPCPIDWLTSYSGTGGIVRTNISPTIWVFNPVTSHYDTYKATSSSTGTATGNASRYIASGQGFVVQATLASPKLTISEYAKAVLNNNGVAGTGAVPAAAQLTGAGLLMNTTPVQASVNQSLRLKLVTDSVNYDDIVIEFNSSYSNNFDPNEDAQSLAGNNAPETLASFSTDGVKLAINDVPLPKLEPQTIKLLVTARAYGTYTLKRTDLAAIPKLFDIWLMDKFKKDSLDIRNNDTYTFDITADTSSFGKNRFQLVIRQNPALGIHLLNFTASKAQSGAQAVWVTENEENYTNFTVEKSTDGGTTYNIVGGYASSGLHTYSLLDKNPANGANLYRLKMEDINGTVSYSKVVTLMYGNSSSVVKTGIVVYPNPVKSTLNLSITTGLNYSVANSNYSIQIANILGTVVTKTTTNSQDWQTDVSNLLPGSYVITVKNSSNGETIGQATFIKL